MNPQELDEPTLDEKTNRAVPWSGWDVFVLFAFWIMMLWLCVAFAVPFAAGQAEQRPVAQPQQPVTEHPLAQLVQHGKDNPAFLLAVCFCGIVLAPIAEEFLFRLLLQGYLVKKIGGVCSILTVSLLFGLGHAGERSTAGIEEQFYAMAGMAAANVLLLAAGLFYLRGIVKATAEDLGWNVHRLVSDFFLALGVFMGVAPVIYTVNYVLATRFPDTVIDPIPIFLFALALGTLYYRTRRLAPSIFLHCLLNGCSFAMLLAFGSR